MPAPPSRRFDRLRLLGSFARPYRRTLAAGLALALVGSASQLASPLLTKWILDALADSRSMAAPVAILLGVAVVGGAIWFVQWNLLGRVGERVVLDARMGLVRRFLGATIPDVTSRPVGELVTRVTSDTVLLREAAAASVIGIVNSLVLLIGTLVLMGVLDAVLLGTTLGAVALVTVLFLKLMPGIAVAQAEAQEHVGHLGGRLEGALRAVRTVKASRAERRLGDALLEDAQRSYDHSVRAIRREALAWTIAWGGLQLAIVLILAVGAYRVDEGLLEVSSLIAFLLYAFGLAGPIMELTQNLTALQSGIAAAGRIQEVEALEQEEGGAAPAASGAPPVPGAPLLELRDVVAAYGPEAEPAVDGVSLALPPRGHVAIVGPSGAGKTTLFSLLLRFLEPQSGELLLEGRPFRELRPADVRERLAYVEQETPVIPGTIRENLLFTHPDATEEELRAVVRAVRLDDLVADLPDGLDTPLTSTSVSGGQRQRIALARALLRAPDVLLLDEVTAQIDGLTELAIHEALERLSRTGLVVTIAHRLSTVVDADRIVVMQDGRIRCTGTHGELVERDELYRDLVEALRISDAGLASVA